VTLSSTPVALPPAAPRWVRRLIEHVGSGAARCLARVDVPQRPEGWRSDLPVIFIGNHRSLFDVLLGMRMVRRWNAPARFMVKADFFDRRLTGPLLSLLGAIPVGTGRSAKTAFDQASLALQRGESIVIMPEARVVPPGERPLGTGELVSTLGRLVKVRPCIVAVTGLIGADDVWPAGSMKPRIRPWRRPNVVIRSYVREGFDDLSYREITALLQDELRAIVRRMEPLQLQSSQTTEITHA
jgi:1-acyl-sn-glycerol-3-phosphate acyltransferase